MFVLSKKSIFTFLVLLIIVGCKQVPIVIDSTSRSTVIGSLEFLNQPVNSNKLARINPSIKVQVKNFDGSNNSSYQGPITISIDTDPNGEAHLLGKLTVNAHNGIATFSDFKIDESASGYKLKANASNLITAISDTFDISAGPNILYRSIGPSSTTALTTGASNTMTITDSTVVFENPLANNIGIGDVIQYDSDNNASIDSIAFIHGRISSTEFKVRQLDGATAPNAVSEIATWSICRAYTSLSSANSRSENIACLDDAIENFDTLANLTSGAGIILNLVAYGDGVDTLTNISGWTTSATEYIRVFTPHYESEVGSSQRHNTVWGSNPSAYMISTGAGDNTIEISSANVYIDGLQIQKTATSSSDECGIRVRNSTSGNIEITNNLIRGVSNSANPYHTGILFWQGTLGTATIANNIIFDFNGTNTSGGINFCRDDVAVIYNNTLTGGYFGMLNDTNCSTASSKTAINNIIEGTNSGFAGLAFNANSDYNLSSHADTIGVNSISSATAVFSDRANFDFSLDASDINAAGNGRDMSSDPIFIINRDARGVQRGEKTGFDIGALDSDG